MTGPVCELRPAVEALAEGELEPGPLFEQAREHLERCDACQSAVEATQELRDAVADAVPMPPADVWRVFDGELRERLRHETPERAGILLQFRRFAPALVAAAALLLAAGLFAFELAEPQTVLGLANRLPVYSIDYGDPLWQPGPERGPVDPSTVEGLPLAADQLTPAALEALERHGLVQVPSGTERLADLYPLAPAPGALPPLATADASLLLTGAVTSRAALALEAELIAPGLRELLAHALVELRALEAGAREADARRATRRARELLGVAALLVGVDPRLPADSLARARAEVERVVAAAGPYLSPVLGRELDARAFAPRGLFAGAPELHGHARAAAWLSLAGLTLDAARPDDVRAGGALALALARGRGERRTGLDLQARLEAAVEVLYGAPDGLTPLDMVEVLRQGLGKATLTVSDLCAPGAVEKLAERARVEAAARGRERVGPPGAPVLRLLGGTASLEGVVLTRLAPPALAARPAPSSLDLLVVLGSRRARTAVSALQLDAPGYDAAVKALGPVCEAWADAARHVPVRTCLEQARLWAAGALVGEDPVTAPVSPGAYRDRLLLAGLAALNAPDASVELASTGFEGVLGPVPLVEPLPRLHARLAFTAERLARVLDDLTTTTRPRPRTVRAIMALRRVARLEGALRDASLAALGGQAPDTTTTEALRDYVPALHALAPASALSVEDVFVQSGANGVRVLHRAVHALDRLLLIVVDPSTGRPVLAAGGALSASEPWSRGGARLAPDSVVEGDRDPRWAVHVVRR